VHFGSGHKSRGKSKGAKRVHFGSGHKSRGKSKGANEFLKALFEFGQLRDYDIWSVSGHGGTSYVNE